MLMADAIAFVGLGACARCEKKFGASVDVTFVPECPRAIGQPPAHMITMALEASGTT